MESALVPIRRTLQPREFVPVPERVADFARRSQMYVVQINAQRFFGPPLNLHPEWQPPHGSEVFVGRIPRYWQEPDLVPFLEQVGPICQLRLMMDFSGTNKGFCFVMYYNPIQANFAVEVLNGIQLVKGRPLVVNISVDNRRLLFSGVPTFLNNMELYHIINSISAGVLWVQPTWPWKAEGHLKGIVIVTYASHWAAAMARKKLLGKKIKIWNYPIAVEWAEPDRF